MSDKEYLLPGFYRDPKTGKYFRDRPGTAFKIQSLEKLKKESENERKILQESTNYSKYSNILKFLGAREIGSFRSVSSDRGSFSGANSERDYCKMIVSKKQLVHEYSLSDSMFGNITKVNYIKGTPSFILGVWTSCAMTNYKTSVITNQALDVSDSLFFHTAHVHNSRCITDLCEGPNETVIYTFNNSQAEKCGFVQIQLQSETFQTSFHERVCLSNLPVYCCASTTDREHFAIGSQKYISYYNIRLERNIPVLNAARVHTISFNHPSNVMAIGVHTGHLNLMDMRTRNNLKSLKLSDYCINDSYFYEPDQVIVAGLEGVLCKVDLRMDKVVTEYFDHKTSTKKSAFSVASNMLCATGADNVTRIWHLSGGSPIHTINPQINPENGIKGWLFSEANKTYLYHFELGFRRTYLLSN